MPENYGDLFGLYKEGVAVERQGKVIYMNAAAKAILPADFMKSGLTSVFPRLILDYEGTQFSSSIDIENKQYLLSVTRLGADRVFSMIGTVGRDEMKSGINGFLSSITGDLRSALSVLSMSADMIKPYLEEADDEKLVRYSAMLSHSAHIAARLTDNIDFLRKINSGEHVKKTEVFDIAKLCRDITETTEHLLRHTGKKITFISREDSILFAGDRFKVEQMLLNLLSNSVKYTSDDGKIEVSAVKSGNGTIISVSDNGSGIPSELLLSSFGRYYEKRDESDGKAGSGIGLAIVDYIAKMHGGSAVLESTGKGTKVTVQLMSEEIDRFSDAAEEYSAYGMESILTGLADVLPYDAYLPKYTD